MLPEFPHGTVAFLWPPVVHCGAKLSYPRRFVRNNARCSLPKPNSWPENQRHSFACLHLGSVSCALQPDCADSIPIAQRSARWFSPTGFLANRSRWSHRRPYRTQCAASARLKTLCIMRSARLPSIALSRGQPRHTTGSTVHNWDLCITANSCRSRLHFIKDELKTGTYFGTLKQSGLTEKDLT